MHIFIKNSCKVSSKRIERIKRPREKEKRNQNIKKVHILQLKLFSSFLNEALTLHTYNAEINLTGLVMSFYSRAYVYSYIYTHGSYATHTFSAW